MRNMLLEKVMNGFKSKILEKPWKIVFLLLQFSQQPLF